MTTTTNAKQPQRSIRLGLCCLFRDQPIKFVTTTATVIGKMKRSDAVAKLSRLCLANGDALLAALRFCAANEIGCFRINSQILPVKTHPDCGYSIDELPANDGIVRRFKECRQFAEQHDLRICFHPDQFVVLNSPRRDVVANSIKELEYQAEVAEWVARQSIDRQLEQCGWAEQDRREMNISVAMGVAIREISLTTGEADYMPRRRRR